MYEYQAIITRVIDGDTLCALVDCGFDIHHELQLRLLGIDCPELRTPEGKAARSFTVEWLSGRAVTVRTVKDKHDSDKRDSFGRYLAAVFIDGRSLNDALVESGLAVRKTY